MIIDSLKNIGVYRNILKGLDEGLSAVEALGAHPETGRYSFEGGYFMIQEGLTKAMDDGDFEAHRKYIDVQIILEGQESVGWSEISELKVSVPYDEAKDKIMYAGEPAECNTIRSGMFWAAFPADAHKACRNTGSTQTSYRKIVMKLPVE